MIISKVINYTCKTLQQCIQSDLNWILKMIVNIDNINDITEYKWDI